MNANSDGLCPNPFHTHSINFGLIENKEQDQQRADGHASQNEGGVPSEGAGGKNED